MNKYILTIVSQCLKVVTTIGTKDCYAGSKTEKCTCSSGDKAVLTGTSATSRGVKYYEYLCCDPSTTPDVDGEKCGDYEDVPAWVIGLAIGLPVGFVVIFGNYNSLFS